MKACNRSAKKRGYKTIKASKNFVMEYLASFSRKKESPVERAVTIYRGGKTPVIRY